MTNWLEKSSELLRNASDSWGIKASLTDLANYRAVFTRDAVMAGIAGLLIKDEVIIDGLKQSLLNLKEIQGKQGQIPSNFHVKDNNIHKVSFGTLSPKIDSCTWYLIGVGLLLKEGHLDKAIFQDSVTKTIELLDGIEYNNKNLMYIPKGGNWADEYVYEGYILYDQVLRVWGLSLCAQVYSNKNWLSKAKAILNTIKKSFRNKQKAYLNASIAPGVTFDKFDLAAHTILGIVLPKNDPFFNEVIDWIDGTFISKGKLPPAFYPTIDENDEHWDALSKYHLFGFKNKPNHYHNGGIWYIWLGWLSISLSIWNRKEEANKMIDTALNFLERTKNFNFDEYVASDTMEVGGTDNLCYTGTGIIFMSLVKQGYDFSVLSTNPIQLIKEPLEIKPEYFEITNSIIDHLQDINVLNTNKLVIGIAGESGSGKSVSARCLQIALEEMNISATILHQDNYYKLPPKDNSDKRKEDINWVGVNELKKEKFQKHINQFKSGQEHILIPIVDYEKNIFSEYNLSLKDKQILIVEGVYAFYLENLDFKILMKRTYKDTLERRKARGRESYDEFVETVLEIEHNLVLEKKDKANAVIDNNYKLIIK